MKTKSFSSVVAIMQKHCNEQCKQLIWNNSKARFLVAFFYIFQSHLVALGRIRSHLVANDTS
jgi:hypothetical protein